MIRRLALLMKNSPLILALDATDIDEVSRLIQDTQESIGVFKLGLEFFTANGIQGVAKIIDRHNDVEIFLDLKLHDIPNTVTKAARALIDISPLFLTVHASGGQNMISAAVNELPNTLITAVTVLTSLDNDELSTMGYQLSSSEIAANLALIAEAAGARAIVSSPLEVQAIRKVVKAETKIITPGIRFAPGGDDQVRTASPKEAISNGADFLVIGRPITESREPKVAAAEILNSIY